MSRLLVGTLRSSLQQGKHLTKLANLQKSSPVNAACIRCHQSTNSLDKTPAPSTNVVGAGKTSKQEQDDLTWLVEPGKIERIMLVKAKMYPSAEEVPEKVTWVKMKRAHDYFRVRVALWMCAGTIFGCAIMIVSGRRARDAGENLGNQALDDIARWRKQGLAEKAEREAAASAQTK